MSSDPRVQIPPGVSMTILGYFKRCQNRSSLFGARSFPLDLVVEHCAIGLRRVPPKVLFVPLRLRARVVARARCTSMTTPAIA